MNRVKEAFEAGCEGVEIEATYGIGSNAGYFTSLEKAQQFMRNQQEDWRTN